jgi:hypothetical protein
MAAAAPAGARRAVARRGHMRMLENGAAATGPRPHDIATAVRHDDA